MKWKCQLALLLRLNENMHCVVIILRLFLMYVCTRHVTGYNAGCKHYVVRQWRILNIKYTSERKRNHKNLTEERWFQFVFALVWQAGNKTRVARWKHVVAKRVAQVRVSRVSSIKNERIRCFLLIQLKIETRVLILETRHSIEHQLQSIAARTQFM